jgi:hypothetical protein
MAFNLIGADFALMGETGVPAPGMVGLLGKSDVFGDNCLGGAILKTQTEDLPITTPELLYRFHDLEARRSGSFEDES